MFEVGQRVVNLHSGCYIKKGEIVIVTAVENCPKCNEPHISVDRLHGQGDVVFAPCSNCRADITNLHSEYVMDIAKHFAPIQEYGDSMSIAMELIQDMERVDKPVNPKVKEVV